MAYLKNTSAPPEFSAFRAPKELEAFSRLFTSTIFPDTDHNRPKTGLPAASVEPRAERWWRARASVVFIS